MARKQPLEKLESDSTDSLAYIGYYLPKTQSELGKLVMQRADSTKSSAKMNINTLMEVRIRLLKTGYLNQMIATHRLNSILLKSSPLPFIEYLKNLSDNRTKISMKGSKRQLTKKELKYVEMFIDSDFFRNTFFSGWFFDNCPGLHRGVVQRNEKERLFVTDAMRYMSLMLQSVAIQSFFLHPDFEQNYVKNIDEIMKNYPNFDDFLNQHFTQVQQSGLEKRISENEKIKLTLIDLGSDEQVKYSFDNIVNNGLFLIFPYELTEKLCAILLSSDLLSLFVVYFNRISKETGVDFQRLRAESLAAAAK